MLASTLSRREFLKTSGSLVVTFSLASLAQQSALAQGAAPKTVSLEQVDAFLAIGADGNVTCYSGKVDLGTGVRTAIAQIVSDELDVAFDKVGSGRYSAHARQGPTYGSLSIQVEGCRCARRWPPPGRARARSGEAPGPGRRCARDSGWPGSRRPPPSASLTAH
jgi:hypothetical protein